MRRVSVARKYGEMKRLAGKTKLYKFMHVAGQDGWKTAFRKTKEYLGRETTATITSEPPVLPSHSEKVLREDLPTRVSVVIPTYNGDGELPLLLKNLKNQKGIAEIELIVVDSGSRKPAGFASEPKKRSAYGRSPGERAPFRYLTHWRRSPFE